MFSLAGLAAAASIVNFVVTTAAASSANSGVFSTGRMLFGLADEGSAPAPFRRLNRGGVPAVALFLTAALLLTSIPLLYVGGSVMGAFTLVTTIAVSVVHVRVGDDCRQLPRLPAPARAASCRLVLQDARRRGDVLGASSAFSRS